MGFKFNYPYFDEYDNAIITTDEYANFGHAVVLVGYDDNIETPEGHGAFKVINSYGEEWGDDGFAYMTYESYVSSIHGGYIFTDLENDDYLDIVVMEGVSFDIFKHYFCFRRKNKGWC